MYAGLNDLKALMLFLKKYAHGGELNTSLIYGGQDLYRFNFADGRSMEGISEEIFEDWAHGLKSNGLINVFAYDLPDTYYDYEVRVYCAFDATPTTWRLERNLNAGSDRHPDKRYFSEYTETVLPPDTAAPHIADPTEKLAQAVNEYIRLVTDVVRYDAYSAGPDYLTRQLQAIYDNLYDKPNAANYLTIDLIPTSIKDRNLYRAYIYAQSFLGDINGKNENVPFDLFEVCENAGRELCLQSARALLYVLNHF